MRYLMIFIAVTLAVLPGCRRSVAPPSDQGQAEKALRMALDAWKNGTAPNDLENGQPSIIVNDDDWRTGKRLSDYKMEQSTLSGRQVRCQVRLNLKDKNDKAVEQKAVYLIDTAPQIVIVRDVFATSSLRNDGLASAR